MRQFVGMNLTEEAVIEDPSSAQSLFEKNTWREGSHAVFWPIKKFKVLCAGLVNEDSMLFSSYSLKLCVAELAKRVGLTYLS